jgi:hypothetical protein
MRSKRSTRREEQGRHARRSERLAAESELAGGAQLDGEQKVRSTGRRWGGALDGKEIGRRAHRGKELGRLARRGGAGRRAHRMKSRGGDVLVSVASDRIRQGGTSHVQVASR